VQVLSEAFSQVGLNQSSAVVLYDGRSSRDAGRLAWTLQVSGHQGPVQILDGGWLQWEAAGLEVATESTTPSAGDWQATEPSADQSIDADWIFARLDDPSVVVLDVRTASEFAEGRIPGAVNVDWSTSVHGQGEEIGTLLPEVELLALYEALPQDATIIVSCQSGARAGHSWAVLPTLGFQDVRLYDGSWNEWSSRDDLPVER
jgi:3-mercaptopyruvate sulfurtransferase SseA